MVLKCRLHSDLKGYGVKVTFRKNVSYDNNVNLIDYDAKDNIGSIFDVCIYGHQEVVKLLFDYKGSKTFIGMQKTFMNGLYFAWQCCHMRLFEWFTNVILDEGWKRIFLDSSTNWFYFHLQFLFGKGISEKIQKLCSNKSHKVPASWLISWCCACLGQTWKMVSATLKMRSNVNVAAVASASASTMEPSSR